MDLKNGKIKREKKEVTLTQNLQNQIRDLDIKVEKFEMSRKYQGGDDFVEAINLRPSMRVLVVGGKASLPSLARLSATAVYVRKISEIHRVSPQTMFFDRVIIMNEIEVTEELLNELATVTMTGGLTSFFYESETFRDIFTSRAEQIHQANVWEFKTNLGPVVIADV